MESIARRAVNNKVANSLKRFINIFTILKLWGLMPLTSRFTVSKKWLVVGIIIYFLVSLLGLSCAYFSYTNFPDNYVSIKKFVILLSTVYSNLTVILHSLTLMIKVDKLKLMFLKMDNLTVMEDKTNNLPKMCSKFLILYMFFHSFASLVIVLKTYRSSLPIVFESFLYISSSLLSNLIILKYCMVTDFAVSTIKHLKKTASPCIILYILERFNEAKALIKLNNELFSNQTLFFVVKILVSTTLLGYTLIYTVQNQIRSVTLLEEADLLGGVIWLMYYSASVSHAKNAVEKFNRKIFKLLMKHGELRKNRRLTSQMLKDTDVSFNVYGFYQGGYPLVTSILEAVVTYIVILIQFNP